MNTIRRLVMWGLAGMVCPAVLIAGGAGTTGASFLKLAMDARSAALGGMQAVPLESESALFGNPSSLADVENMGFSFTYASWFQGIRFGNLSFVYPRDRFTIGLGAIYLNYGEIPGYDVHANPTGNFSAQDLCALVGIGANLGRHISVGGTAKFLNEKIEEKSATGVGLDIGALYHSPFAPLRLGFVAQHIGLMEMKFVKEDTPWPTLFRFGSAYAVLRNSLTFVAEGNSIVGDDIHFSGGAQYGFQELFFLRIGYRTGPSDVGSGLCAGAGLSWKHYGFNYAFEPYGVLGDTHRFTILVQLRKT